MANMATDSWLPHRFAQLSDRLTMQNGVLLMGGRVARSRCFYTRGDITHLVTMYSINVFVTFSLSQLAMLRYWWQTGGAGRRRGFAIHGVAFVLCAAILAGTVYEKGEQGGWVTLVVTGLVVGLCFVIRRHYRTVQANLRRLDDDPGGAAAAAGGPAPRARPEGADGGAARRRATAASACTRSSPSSACSPASSRTSSSSRSGSSTPPSMKGIEEVDRVRLRTQARSSSTWSSPTG